MTAQLRQSAVPMGANIAEGSKRKSPTDKARIFNIAQGEAAEAVSVLDLADRLRYGRPQIALKLFGEYDHLIGMLESLRQHVLGDNEASG